MSSSFALGVYLGETAGTASYDADLSQFTSDVGEAPTVVEQFLAYTGGSEYSWVAATQSLAYTLANSPGGTSNIPLLSLPMFSQDQPSALAGFDLVASGAYDSIWSGIVDAYAAEGFKTIDLRIGWEMNGTWYPWSVSDAATAQGYIAAWQDMVTVMRAEAAKDGVSVQFIWAPVTKDDSTVPVVDSYPGNNYVDMIGLDIYDTTYPATLYDWSTGQYDTSLAQWWSNPVNLEHYWNYPDATKGFPTGSIYTWGLAGALAFAEQQGKPIALPETGTTDTGTSSPPNDALFPEYLADMLLAPGAPSVALVMLWDKVGTSYEFTSGYEPAVAAAWADFVRKLNQDDAGPQVGTGKIYVAHNQTDDITAALQAAIIPGRTGDTETISNVSAVTGKVSIAANGDILYTAGAAGTDTLTWTITDQLNDTITATTTLVIDPGPTIKTAAVKVAHGQTVTLASLSALLVTPGLTGDTETFSHVTAANGTITVGANGVISYTPPASGTDTLSYTVTDEAGNVVTGSNTITVDPGPSLALGSYGTTPGAAVNLKYEIGLSTTVGLPGDTETITAISDTDGLVSQAANGTITYTAPASGRDVITYTVTDQLGDTATGTYWVTVNPADIQGTVKHFGGATDPVYGGADPGVNVTLLTASGSFVASLVTNSGGFFNFTNLLPGSYVLEYFPPAGQAFQTGTKVVNTTTGLTAPITVTASQTYVATSVPMVSVVEFSGQVVNGGAGEAGVTVTLEPASGKPVATVTDSNGDFTFNNLAAGSYQILYSVPAGQYLLAGGPANPATGLTATYTEVLGNAVVLPTETLASYATIKGSVAYTAGAPSGVLVELVNAAGSVLASQTTTASGSYSFTTLLAGSDEVLFSPPVGEAALPGGLVDARTGLAMLPATVAAGQTLVLATETLVPDGIIQGSVTYSAGSPAGVVVSLLSGTGTVLATQTTGASGSYSFTGLTAGAYLVQFAPPAGEVPQVASQINATTGLATVAATLAAGQDFTVATEGFNAQVANAVVEGTTYLITSISMPVTTAPQPGVTVSLVNALGAVVATTVSNAAGWYEFTHVAAGTYQEMFTPPAFEALWSAGYVSTTTGLTPAFSLAAGATLWEPQALLVPTVGAITGTVVYQNNPQSGVVVALLNAAGQTVTSTATDSNGAFSFIDLAPGAYQLLYTPAPGEMLAPGGPADTATGLTSTLNVTAGTTLAVGPETLMPAVATLTGTVTENGAAEANVTVNLTNAGGTSILATTTTSATGSYTFTGLATGSYAVQFIAPPGQVLQTGSLASVATGLSQAVAVVAGQTTPLAAENLLSQPAMLEGSINHLGSADPSWGTAQSGVTVSLLNAAGTVIATTTDTGGGWFEFTNLAAGTYQLLYTPPAGEALVAMDGVNATTGLSQSLTLGAGSTLWAPTAYMQSTSTSFTMAGTYAVALRGAGNYVVTGSVTGATLTLGAGNDSITLTGNGNTITTGSGNETIVLSGTGNKVTTGTGNSTINAGSGNAVVHAGDGNVTITAGGANNLLDAGPGTNFLNTDGSAGNVYELYAAQQGVTTITGFNIATTDVLDLAHTLAGVSILPDLSNVGKYITAAVSAGSTTLYADVTAAGGTITPTAIAVLSGVSTSVSSLISGHHLSMA